MRISDGISDLGSSDLAPIRDDPLVPGRPQRPVEPRRGGHGPRHRRTAGRGRPRLRVARRPPARRRLLAPVLHRRGRRPHRGRAGQARRNVCAYIAAGVWHRWLLAEDRGFVEAMWPTVERAIDFVLDLQTPRGEILWARHADGTPWSFALLTGSSSICHSLRCAIAIAKLLGHDRPDWELSAARLARVIREIGRAFAPKPRWAMDWY